MGMQYEIYRVSVASPTSSATTFEMETFSSASGEWTKSSFVLPTLISLGVAFGPTLMLEGVIYWRGYDRLGVVPDNISRIVMVAYDPARESSVEIIRLLSRQENIKTWTNVIGHSEGKICHARTDSKEIEV
ncbi:hypothetical protein BUALT_Bualt09G0054800 [Buddleja alternifolia]|uniref:F-box protein At3g26010-like beta-propeller domain-containing protein n=1 Tax=Buddleja alternifolia TaxID=168488 RepID=A0AAV6XB16_9LAMI|nr:hypothetical protein BUALT_Bualt09G0054800 [Buddleja alternifolia]